MKLRESFSKNTENFMKIRWVGAEFLHAERRTDRQKDMTMLIVAFFAVLLTRLQWF